MGSLGTGEPVTLAWDAGRKVSAEEAGRFSRWLISAVAAMVEEVSSPFAPSSSSSSKSSSSSFRLQSSPQSPLPAGAAADKIVVDEVEGESEQARFPLTARRWPFVSREEE